jgi:arginyl-tRNA synthetase
VTDKRQHEHFEMVFAAAGLAGWAATGQLEHVGFGLMLGEDGRPFKTRDGGTIKLQALVAEAEERAYPVARELSPELTEDELQHVARVVGRSTVKYADLVHAAETDYRFDWDKMLAKDGNTAVYQLYAYARTRSIGRRAACDLEALLADVAFDLRTPQEAVLAKRLLRTPEVWELAVAERAPHLLLAHLFEIAQAYSSFYNGCPGIIHEEDAALRNSRLGLCGLVGRTLRWGLSMVGISTLERM